jgi:D-3-phosphoglycerate dehydrogenase / 2-oxoglutarate reductase
MKKILNTIGDTYTDEAKKILSSVGEADYKILTQDELLNIIEDYDVAVIGLGLNFDKLVLDKAKKLKAVATATTGLDHIDTEHAKEKGIEVISLRGQTEFLDTITGTAELAFGIIINLFRRIHPAFDHVKGGGWNREAFIGHNMSKRVLLVRDVLEE